jgi:hypothetical protein
VAQLVPGGTERFVSKKIARPSATRAAALGVEESGRLDGLPWAGDGLEDACGIVRQTPAAKRTPAATRATPHTLAVVGVLFTSLIGSQLQPP